MLCNVSLSNTSPGHLPLFILQVTFFFPQKTIHGNKTGNLAHLFLDTGGHWLDLGDQGGWVETPMRGHRGTGLVHLCSLLLCLLDVLINCLPLGGVHYSSNVNPLKFMYMWIQVCMHVHVSMDASMQMFVSMVYNACVCMRMRVCVYAHMWACAYTYRCMPLLS